jgi:hypothetical protein
LHSSRENPKAKGAFCKFPCLLRESLGAGAWSSQEDPDATSCFLPLQRREDPPWSIPTAPRLPPLSHFLPGSLPFSLPRMLAETELSRHGRHLAPPFRAPPCCPDVLRRSASPSSVSPLKELQPLARNRRRRRRFLAGNRPSPPPNSSPPAILRPGRPPRRFPGEALVRLDPFPSPLSRRSARHGWPPVVPGSRSGWPCPADLVNPGQPRWPGAPPVSLYGSFDPGYKELLQVFFASRNFRKMPNVVKFIGKYLCVRKMRMIYQNAQKNMLYLFVSKSCIFNQL